MLVSTDDTEIAAVAQDLGAEVPFVRPADLADDYSTTAAVMAHAVRSLRAAEDNIEQVCCLYATAPFVRAADIRAGQAQLAAHQADYSFSVTTFPFPIQRALRLDDQGCVSMLQPDMFAVRSQDLEEAWHDAGQFYWGSAAAWLAQKPIFNSHAVAVPLPRHRVQDIDTPEDWRRAELLWRLLQAKEQAPI